MQQKILLIGAVSILLLSGCIYRDRSEDYQKAGSIKSLVLPEDIRSAPLEELYPVPPVAPRTDSFYDLRTDGFVVPRPEPMIAEGEGAKVRIQRVGEQQWILLEAPASQIWPLTQSYLSEAGILVERSNPTSGLIETRWVEFKSDSTTRSRFRIEVEQGLRPETTEVHIAAQQVPAADVKTSSWTDASVNSERAKALLEDLANSLAADIENNAASLLGQSVGGEVKAKLLMEGAEPVLRLQLQNARAWATLTHALKEDEFRLWGESTAQGLLYFQYLDEDKRRGRFMRMLRGRTVHQIETAPHTQEEITAHLADEPEVRATFANTADVRFGNALEDQFGYLLRVEQTAPNMARVTLRDARGKRLPIRDHKKILMEIRDNLI